MNVALLGYGFAGRIFHAPLIRGVSGLRLSAVVSSRAEAARRDLSESDISIAATPDAVFSDPIIDLVVIATPNDTHFDLASRALAAGKHVVVDKPFTTTVAEAAQLAEMAAKAGRLLSVFHNRRWDADFVTLRRILVRGELGALSHFESHYDRYRPTVTSRWREGAGAGSGIWFDLGSHLVDQVLHLFGPPESLYADLGIQRGHAVAVDYFHVLLRYGGMRVVLHGSNLVAGESPRFHVHGTSGSFVKYGTDAQEEALKRGLRPGSPDWGADPRPGTLTTRAGQTRQDRVVPMMPGNYAAYYEALRDAIRDGAPNPVPPQEALAVIKILELGCQSAAERKELPFPI